MSGWIMIHESELLAALEDVEPCSDCAGGRGVHIDFATGDHDAVVVHNQPCPATASQTPALRLVPPPYEDSHRRCRRCFGLLAYDLGDGVFGEQQLGEHCPRCDPRPGAFDTRDDL